MSEKTFCPTCGQPMDRYKHSISRMLSNILLTVRNFHVPFHLQKDAKLTKNQYNNFQKLHYWGLVSNDCEESGYWFITYHGRRFLNGEISIPKWVQTFNNSVVDESDELIHISKCIELSNSYKQKPEYIEDRETHDIQL